MATTYGLTALGFVAKRQAVIKAEIEVALQQAFGINLNLLPESVLGQLVGIFSEREALLWELAEAVYASQYPPGAEGTSVDNILALNNLRRLSAMATRTDPTVLTQDNGVPLYGLVLYGTPGTVIPKDSIISTDLSPPRDFTLDAAVTIGAAVDAVQTLFFSGTPDAGSFILLMGDSELPTPSIAYNAQDAVSELVWGSTPTTGHFKITLVNHLGTLSTAFINWNDNAATIQTAIRALSGYSGVTVTGAPNAGPVVITWGAIENPLVTATASTLDHDPTPVDSVQAAVNSVSGFSGVTVSGTFGGGFVMTFAGVNGAVPQPITQLDSSSLMDGIAVVNVAVSNTTQGAQARAVGSATCTETGPVPAPAGHLVTIGSPVSGWSTVTNELDTVVGSDVEDDTQALTRRSSLLDAQANGPLQAIVEKVLKVAGVTACIGFENTTDAALQVVSFSGVPGSGHFTLSINGLTTGFINYNATSADVQAAIRLLSGYPAVLVTGDFTNGFTVDFAGAHGGQPQDLFTTGSNTLGVTIGVAYGRPGKSFEIVVQGGTNADIATEILNSKPAGIQSYGNTTVQVLDVFSNPYSISFTRPSQVPIYVAIVLETDLTFATSPKFNPSSIPTIQEDVVSIGNEVGIGGLVVGFGTNGLIGAFNNVPGIRSYTLKFGIAPSPTLNANIQLLPEQVPDFQTFNVAVSYT